MGLGLGLVSLCRLAKTAAKGWATPHAKSPGDMWPSFTFEAQLSEQMDGGPRVGAKKASDEIVK